MEKISRIIEIDHGKLIYYPAFYSPKIADEYFLVLNDSLQWRQDQINMFGKVHQVPRLQAWYGDPGMHYAYSGIKLEALEWQKDLFDIKSDIQNISNFNFNSVLANLYRDGSDSNGWHADNEKELGINPVIASISFGEERVFQMKHKYDKRSKLNITLEHGSLLLMLGETQHYWLHQIAKSKKVTTERINLTFREIKR